MGMAELLAKWSKRAILGLAGLGLAVGLSGGVASAQDKMEVFGGYSYGTNGISTYCDYGCTTGLHGYATGFAYNFNPYLGMEGAFTGHSGSNTVYSELPTTNNTGENETQSQALYVYTFGPRLTLATRDFSLYTHLLVGGIHTSGNYADNCIPATGSSGCWSDETGTYSGSGFAVRVGGGVNWRHGAWGIRILGLDYVHGSVPIERTSNLYGTYNYPSSGSAFEMVTGVTFNFGHIGE